MLRKLENFSVQNKNVSSENNHQSDKKNYNYITFFKTFKNIP